MPRLRLLDLLGVATPGAAVASWPAAIQPDVGAIAGDTSGAIASLITELDAALLFESFRPGADPDRVGFTAQVRIAVGTTRPLVAATMPDVAFYLEPSGHHSPHVFVTRGDDGVEIVAQGVPVKIALPLGLLAPGLQDDATGSSVTPVRLTAPFDPDVADSLEIVVSNSEPSTIRVRANLRLTRTGDVMLQPVVPISVGPCRFSGLPCRGLHDVQLYPSLRLGHVPEYAIRSELPFKWLRYHVEKLIAPLAYPSALSIRTIDVDPAWAVYDDLRKKMLDRRPDASDAAAIDLVLEDLVIPLGLGLPLPLHGRFALRRRVLETDAGDLYNLESAPARFDLGDTQLVLSRVLLQTELEGGSPAAFSAQWIRTDDPTANLDDANAWTTSLTEDGALEVGRVIAETQRRKLFEAGGAIVRLAAFKVGAFVWPVDSAKEFKDIAILVADFDIDTSSSGSAAMKPFEIRKRGEPGYILLRGVGWRGGPTFGSIYNPDGLDLVVVGRKKVRITEAGIVGAHGRRYASVSATAESSSKTRDVSVTVRRLKIRLDGDPPAAPLYELDGLEIAYKSPTTELRGFGLISDYEKDGTRFFEIGAEIDILTSLMGRGIEIGAQLLIGTARGAEDFDFWLAGLTIGRLSLGATVLWKAQALVARDFAPLLPAPNGDEPALRMFHWYKAQGDPLALPLSRKLDAWTPKPNALAIGIGLTVELAATHTVQLRGFLFHRNDGDEEGVLAGFELYLFKAEQPAMFLVYEADNARRWSLAGGLDLSLEKLLGPDMPDALDFLDVVHLTGSVLICNEPDTTAIGQYPDPTTWIAVSFAWGTILEIRLAFCYHRVDDPDPTDPSTERINALAFTASIKGEWEIAAVASGFQIYGLVDLRHSQWRTAAVAAGTTAQFEFAVRLRLFGWFRFGADIKLELAWLGPEGQEFSRRSFVIRIETPWFLPDVTIRWEKVKGHADSARMRVCSRPVANATALDRGNHATPLPPAPRTNLPDAPTHALADLRASAPVPATDADFAALVPVATDAVIAVDLGATVDASATVLPPAPVGASHQQSGEVHARYELTAIGIRRRARFGPDAGVWRDLIAAPGTQLPALGNIPANVASLFHSSVAFAWDADATRLGRLDARRLLINADTPYTLTTLDLLDDETLATAHPKWPCCLDVGHKPEWHRLDFAATPLGETAPQTALFSDSRSTLRWSGEGPIVLAAQAMSNAPAAGILAGRASEGTIAVATFDRPAAAFELTAAWSPQHTHAVLRAEAFRGLELVASSDLQLRLAHTGAATVADPRGITHVVLRKLGAPELTTAIGAIAPIVAMRYQTVDEALRVALGDARCDAADQAVHGSGALAWLPNHDYEVMLATRIELEHEGSATQDATVEEHVRFRTKGQPGFNATPGVGDELAPYVESVYPRPGMPLYRDEPIAIAFTDRWSRYAIVDRVLTGNEPDEQQQDVEWGLAIERTVSPAAEQMTATAADWIVAHRGTASPPGPPWFDGFLVDRVRRVGSLEPRRVRFDTMVARPGACGQGLSPRASSVLVHAPVPDAQGTAAWPGSAQLTVNVRVRGAAWVSRQPLEAGDASALTSSVVWTLVDGALRPPAAPQLVFGVFGDADWDHLTATVAIAAEGTAGVGFAVAGQGTAAVYALVRRSATGAELVLVQRDAGADTTLASSPIDPGVALVTLTAFDDVWRAESGDVRVEAPRGALRVGRAALIAGDGGGVRSVDVHGLDGYRIAAATSRWRSFAEHVHSFSGSPHVWRPDQIVGAPQTPASMLATTAAEVAAAALPDSDPEFRERLFDRWLEALALPARAAVTQLEITRYELGNVTHALLLESPEPLPIGDDIRAAIHRHTPPHFPIVVVPHVALRDGGSRRLLLITTDQAGAPTPTAGPLTLYLALSRSRYRASEPDALYAATVELPIP